MRWLEERRVELASELLLNSNLNVTRVSERVGYANPFYFSRVFKKHRTVSPQRYRHAAEPGTRS
jgi:YesN/AraC family two-component response regulator